MELNQKDREGVRATASAIVAELARPTPSAAKVRGLLAAERKRCMATLPERAALPEILQDSPPCSCAKCASMCARPCWPAPFEIAPLVAAGEGDRLMLDWWDGDFHDGAHDRVYLVCPANPGRQGGKAPEMNFMDFFSGGGELTNGGCVFFAGGLCGLHDRGLKPIEGRAAHHAKESKGMHEAVARLWDTDEGRAVASKWALARGLGDPYDETEDSW